MAGGLACLLAGSMLTNVGEAAECSSTAPDATSAVAMAQSCSRDVEALSARTPWATLYATAGGQMRLEQSAVAQRTEVDGSWVPIDNDVVRDGAGLVVAAPVADMTFSDGSAGQPLASIERDGQRIDYGFPLDLPTPIVAGNTITYGDVLPGVDLVVNVNDDATGFSNVLRIDDAQAGANPALATLDIPLETSSALDVVPAPTGFNAVDADGETVFTSPAATMWDSSGDATTQPSAGASEATDRTSGPAIGDEVSTMTSSLTDDGVRVQTDKSMLTDPETVYPVYVDPSISASIEEWVAIRNVYSSKYKFDGDEGVGLCDHAVVADCPQTYKSRIMWEFRGDMDLIGDLDPDDIVSATFKAYGAFSYSCTPTEVKAYRTNNISSASTWNTWDTDTDDYLSSVTVAHRDSCSASGQPGWDEWPVADAAKYTASNNYESVTIGLAASETSMSGWHRYRDDAKLSVTYNRAPNTPTSLKVAGLTCGSTTRDTTPSLTATVSDPDPGDRVAANFNVYKDDGTLVWNGPYLAYAAAPHTFSDISGTLASGSYQLRVYGKDAAERTSSTATCNFTVDATPPATPSVASTVYPENKWSGGVGKAGSFTFTDASSDVVSYKYSFNDDAMTSSASGKTATVTFTPTASQVGSQSLYVAAVDAAGNVSTTPKLYRFNVNLSTKNAWWTLDESSGATAVDSKAGNNLTLTGVTHVPGPLQESGFNTTDNALRFGGTSAYRAVSASPSVSLTDTYTVVAVVKPDSVGTYSAVSENGASVSGFTLGTVTNSSSCLSGCWAFTTYPTDAASPGTPVQAVSALPVSTSDWTLIAGTYDATAKSIKIYACTLGGAPVVSAGTPYTATWDTTGKLELGRALSAGAATQFWPGVIDNVTVYDTISVDELNRRCNPFG
ncbi:LamG domain-containing protein [Cellulomonas rhizosphaerae]|uniref:LamG domain-containing protein n=1 Tax=Cellulomonas rhizosphaerae TaxID=2293719 RepID=A0A413RPD8_9CELL|nr:LamG domain-containing protein [Cellulomonas rhizosphaerae]